MLTWHVGLAGSGKYAQALLRFVQARLIGPNSCRVASDSRPEACFLSRHRLYPASFTCPVAKQSDCMPDPACSAHVDPCCSRASASTSALHHHCSVGRHHCRTAVAPRTFLKLATDPPRTLIRPCFPTKGPSSSPADRQKISQCYIADAQASFPTDSTSSLAPSRHPHDLQLDHRYGSMLAQHGAPQIRH